MTLKEAQVGQEYVIREIVTDDEELNAFLFSLGCYSGETITVVTRRRSGCVVSIKIFADAKAGHRPRNGTPRICLRILCVR